MRVNIKKLIRLGVWNPPEIAEILKYAKKPGKNKYGAVRTEYNGKSYASKAEAHHAQWLDAQGLRWKPQPRFHLGCPENTYVADFAILDAENNVVRVHEVKGRRTAKFNHDVRLWKQYGPCPLLIYHNGKLEETVYPKGEN